MNIADAAQIYPQPEYVLGMGKCEFKLAKKFLPAAKTLTHAPEVWWQTKDETFSVFIEHLSELYEVYESLVDEESKKTFRGYWLGSISNQIGKIVCAKTPQYICPGFLPKEGDVLIDCGVYDGGTSLRFVNMGCKVYGFEPDKKIFKAAEALAKERNFVVENFGLGAFKHVTNFDRDGIKINPQGEESVQITTLDSYVGEKNLPRVDFIKMDVEGAELDILKGAAITIAKYKPVLALSAYHKPDDFWTLMNFVKSIRPDYEFAMRQYATTIEDMSSFFPEEFVNFLENFGLEVNLPDYGECVLFAR